ncbi:MAG: hypothetical protein Q8P29_01090 [Candidatus Levybacteria bacterium]|nr:hypothetical protein [Candidatus Levybacteria bacterium]MDZ4228327.1 hypothetical protein [Candidatus Levybacteria bacterium]
MNIWLVIIIIAIVSVVLSIVALVDLENKSHISKTQKKLFKGRVIFHRV